MARPANFEFPVQWGSLLSRVLEIVPAEHHAVVFEIAAALAHRDEAIENFLSYLDEPMVFHFKGRVTALVSDAFPVQRGGYVYRLYLTASTEASTDSTFNLLLDGVQIGDTFTLPASEGDTPYEFDVESLNNIEIPKGSKVAVESATVGTGLQGIVVHVLVRG